MRFGLSAFACLLCLVACGDWKTDPASLTARTAAPAAGMGCASCHAYPPQDSNHLYHLYLTRPDKNANGPITCLDCHVKSMRVRQVAHQDTLFGNPDPAGEIPEASSMDNPWIGPGTFSDSIRHWPINRIEARLQNNPVPQPGRPAPASDTAVAEFMTGLAHMNGSVDVIFDAKYTDSARFGGQAASFNPKAETCSAVSCHPGNDPYRFAAPSKGLTGLKE